MCSRWTVASKSSKQQFKSELRTTSRGGEMQRRSQLWEQLPYFKPKAGLVFLNLTSLRIFRFIFKRPNGPDFSLVYFHSGPAYGFSRLPNFVGGRGKNPHSAGNSIWAK